MGRESFIDQKENQPLVTSADVGREAPKDKISETVNDGLNSLKEENSEVATSYEREFSPEEMEKIDDVLNRINETWRSLALADDVEGVKKEIRNALDEGDLVAKKEKIKRLL